MFKPFKVLFVLLTILPLASCQKSSKQTQPILEVENPLAIKRTHETISLSTELVQKAFPNQTITFVQIKDVQTDSILTSQAIDTDENGTIDATF